MLITQKYLENLISGLAGLLEKIEIDYEEFKDMQEYCESKGDYENAHLYRVRKNYCADLLEFVKDENKKWHQDHETQ